MCASFCEYHCTYCVNIGCQASKFCSVLACPNKCGMQMHKCKFEEHLEEICSHSFVTCINSVNGCSANVRRNLMASHMRVCPANVIFCRILCRLPKSSTFMAGSEASKDMFGCFSDYSISRMFPSSGAQEMCGALVPRSHYAAHTQMHSDVMCQGDGWIELRCPLHALGCSFTVVRLKPHDLQHSLLYNPISHQFSVGLPSFNPVECEPSAEGSGFHVGLDDLPVELIIRVTEFLDDSSVFNLSKVNHRLHSLLQPVLCSRLVVTPVWCSSRDSSDHFHWGSNQVSWSIPDRTQSIDKWCITSARTKLIEHLRDCPFNVRTIHEKPFSLLRKDELSLNDRA